MMWVTFYLILILIFSPFSWINNLVFSSYKGKITTSSWDMGGGARMPQLFGQSHMPLAFFLRNITHKLFYANAKKARVNPPMRIEIGIHVSWSGLVGN